MICIRNKEFYPDICNKHKNSTKIIWEHLNQLLDHGDKIAFLYLKIFNPINNFFISLGPDFVVSNLPSPKFHYSKNVNYQAQFFLINAVFMLKLLTM